jgi:YHS domain-containing protein
MSYFFIRLLLLAGIGYLLYKMLWKGERPSFFTFKKKPQGSPSQNVLEEMKKDPVCGTYVPEHQSIKYKAGGETHYFCSPECKETFQQLQEK